MNKILKNTPAFVAFSISSLVFSVLMPNKVTLSQGNQSQLNLPADEFIPHYPISCTYIKRSTIKNKNTFSRVVCSRGGDLSEEIDAQETETIGVILINGDFPRFRMSVQTAEGLVELETGRYWCSGEAPGLKNSGRRGHCTKDGWLPIGN